jgi:hypothetical protein
MDQNELMRAAALQAALELHQEIGGLHLQVGVDEQATISDAENRIVRTAERFTAWLGGTRYLTLTAGTVVRQGTGQPTGTPIDLQGGDMPQLHDDEQVKITAHTADAKGFETTGDQLTWDSSDTSVVAVTPATDGSNTALVVAGNVGTGAVVTLTDNSVTPPLVATVSFDVIAAGTAAVNLEVGTPEKQPAAPTA